jgi:hypothetical protein
MIGVADQEKLKPVEPIRNGYLRQVEKMPDDAEMWKKLSRTRKCGPKIVVEVYQREDFVITCRLLVWQRCWLPLMLPIHSPRRVAWATAG